MPKVTLQGQKQVFGVVVDIDSIRVVDNLDFAQFTESLPDSLETLRQSNKRKFFTCFTKEAIRESDQVMCNAIDHHQMSSTLVAGNLLVVDSTAALAGGQLPWEAWPKIADSSYLIAQQDSSFSSFFSSPAKMPITDIEFTKRIAEFYMNLAEGQEPLGREFEQIWDANATSLYES